MCVCVCVGGCAWPWQWPEGVIYLQRLSLFLLLHCGSVCPPTAHWNDIQTPPWIGLHVRVCPSDFRFLGTQRGGPFFFWSHCCTTIRVFLYSPSVYHHFHPVHSPPPVPAQILGMRGVMPPPVTESLKSKSTPPMACCSCCEADVFDLQRFLFKNRCASKISTSQVSLYPLWQRITNMSLLAFVNLPVFIWASCGNEILGESRCKGWGQG